MKTLLDKITEVRAKTISEEVREERKYQKESAAYKAELNNLKQNLRPAKMSDYVAWLKVRVETFPGTEIKHISGGVLHAMYVATKNDLHVPKLFGAFSVKIIIPPNIKFNPQVNTNIGHNQVFLPNGEIHSNYHPMICTSDEVINYLK